MQEMKLQDLKTKSPTELLSFAEEVAVENASAMRKQELMFAILKQLAARDVEITGTGVVEVLQDGFGFLRSPDSNYLAGPDDIYVSPVADPPVRSPHRRHRRRPDQKPEGRRALFRPAQGQHHQFRGPREAAAQDPLRQSDAALSRRVARDGNARSDPQGQYRPGDRHRVADRQGPARTDRGPAAHRQDRDPPEHRPCRHRQPPRVLSDRAVDRRAARGSHRHAALGEGRGDLLHLRRAGVASRASRRDGDREGQAPGRAQARRGDPARTRSRASAAPTTRWCRRPARC